MQDDISVKIIFVHLINLLYIFHFNYLYYNGMYIKMLEA